MAAARVDELACVVAVRAADDDDDVGLAGQVDGGTLPFLRRLIHGVDETDFRLRKSPSNQRDQVLHPLDRLRRLGGNPCATPALCVPDRGLVYASESLNLACRRDFDYRTCMEQELPLMTGEALQKTR
jgi:hypothetical protein